MGENEPSNEKQSPVDEEKLKSFRLTLEPVIFIFVFLQATSEPVLTELILKRTCKLSLEYNDTICDALGTNSTQGHESESLVQPAASTLLLYKQLLGAVAPTLLSLLLGPWSDVNGRKPVVIFSLIGCLIMYVVYAALTFVDNLSPAFFLLGVVPFALLGGGINLATALFCYISDTSTPESRVFRLGVMASAMEGGLLLGLILGPIIFIAGGEHGYLVIFGAGAILSGFAALYVIFFIPESVKIDPKLVEKRRLFNFEHIADMVKTCIRKREKGRRQILFLCILMISLGTVTSSGEGHIIFIFTRLQFGWSMTQFMNYSSIILALVMIGTIFSSWLIPQYFKKQECFLAMVSLVLNAIQRIFILLCSADRIYLFYIAGGFGLLQGALTPAVSSILTKSVPTDEIGKVFSLVSSVDSLISLSTSPLYVAIYKAFLTEFPPSPFILSSFLNIIMIFCMGFIWHIQRGIEYTESKGPVSDAEQTTTKM